MNSNSVDVYAGAFTAQPMKIVHYLCEHKYVESVKTKNVLWFFNKLWLNDKVKYIESYMLGFAVAHSSVYAIDVSSSSVLSQNLP